jgi:catechol 2,3-dioxygenase-like lactoylglutathione lyase family enzyme
MNESKTLAVTAFDHVTLICADLNATRRFYVDLLGMKEVTRPGFSFPGLWFQVGNVQIHATQASPEAGEAGRGDRGVKVISRGHHLAFSVDDMPATLEVLEAQEVPIASKLQQRPDGLKQVYVYDPDGHVIELVSR